MIQILNKLKKYIEHSDSTYINFSYPCPSPDIFDEIRPLHNFLKQKENEEYSTRPPIFADRKWIWGTTYKKMERLEAYLKQLENEIPEKTSSHHITISGNNNNVAINNSAINNSIDIETLLSLKELLLKELSEAAIKNDAVVEMAFDDIANKTNNLEQKTSLVETIKSFAPLITVVNGTPMVLEKVAQVVAMVIELVSG